MRQPVMQKYFENELITSARGDNSAAVTDENYGLPSTDPRYESVPSEPGL